MAQGPRPYLPSLPPGEFLILSFKAYLETSQQKNEPSLAYWVSFHISPCDTAYLSVGHQLHHSSLENNSRCLAKFSSCHVDIKHEFVDEMASFYQENTSCACFYT